MRLLFLSFQHLSQLFPSNLFLFYTGLEMNVVLMAFGVFCFTCYFVSLFSSRADRMKAGRDVEMESDLGSGPRRVEVHLGGNFDQLFFSRESCTWGFLHEERINENQGRLA